MPDTPSTTDTNSTTAAQASAQTGTATGTGDAQASTAAAPNTTNPDEPLGEPGKRALDAERAARREAERKIAELEAQAKQTTNVDAAKDKTDFQRLADQVAALQAENAAFKATQARQEFAKREGIPSDLADLLNGANDAENHVIAERLKKHLAPASDFQGSVDQGARGASERSIDDEIADANKAGNLALVMRLKAKKLGSLAANL